MPSRVECTVYCHRRVVGQPSELPERGCTANSDHMASHRAMPRTILEHYTLGNATCPPPWHKLGDGVYGNGATNVRQGYHEPCLL
jgi:hypothetical protein